MTTELSNLVTTPNLVSTVIPVYNRPQFLMQAVDSLLSQTHRPIEIIIVDDGSTDETPQIAKQLSIQYPDFIRFLQQSNYGPGRARETGRQLAKGEFIQYLDSDDRLLPNKFTKQIQALRDNPDCGIAYGYTRLIDENGTELKAPFKWTDRDIPFLFPSLLVDRWWCTHTPLYRRTVTDKIGSWSDLRWSQDWEYDARAGAMGIKLVNCHEYVSEHRQHSGDRQTSNANWTTDPERLKNRLALLNALWFNAEQAGVSKDSPEAQHFVRWAFMIARHCGAAELLMESKACLDLAIKVNRSKGSDLKLYTGLCRLLGIKIASQLTMYAINFRRSPSKSTLPQSFL